MWLFILIIFSGFILTLLRRYALPKRHPYPGIPEEYFDRKYFEKYKRETKPATKSSEKETKKKDGGSEGN